MKPPGLTGLHSLKIPVSDLEANIEWYQRVLSARHVSALDHVDADGTRYAAILKLPSAGITLELRMAPQAAVSTAGYDPVSFAVRDDRAVDLWADFLSAEGVEHSPVITSMAGPLLILRTPDGLHLRILPALPDDLESIMTPTATDEPTGPWLAPPIMAYRR